MLHYIWYALSIIWVILTASVLRRRMSAGLVLLDLGPARTRYLMLAAGTILGLVAVVQFTSSPDRWAQHLAYLAWATYLFVVASGRVQVREKGLFTAVDLLPWEQIDHADFADEKLTVQVKGRTRPVIIPLRLSVVQADELRGRLQHLERTSTGDPA